MFTFLNRILTFAYRVAQRLTPLDVTHAMLLDTARVDAQDESDFEFRFLSADDVRRFAEVPESDLDAVMASRLSTGKHFCFAALAGNRLAHYAWYAIESIEAEHNRGRHWTSGVGFSLPDGVAFRYKAYTSPLFRGHRLYGRAMVHAAHELRQRGIHQILCTADWSNHSALRACYSIGHRYVGLIWRFGLPRCMATIVPSRLKCLDIIATSDIGTCALTT